VAKLKEKQKENSQTSEKSDPETKKVEEIVEDEEKNDDEEKIEAKPVKKVEKDENAQRVLMEIEMLQSDGRFRVELLHQMQELNTALVLIAGALADLTENGK